MELDLYRKDGTLKKLSLSKLFKYLESSSVSVENFDKLLEIYVSQRSSTMDDLNSLLQFSIVHGNVKICEFLIRKGADLNTKTEYGGMTTFLYVSRDCNNLDTLKILVKYGADINVVSKYNTNAIQFASMKNPNPDILRYLIQLGFRTDVRDDGKSLLMLAARTNSNPAILRMLIEYGCNIFEYNRDWDCLFYALESGQNIEVVKFILDQAYSQRFFRFRSLDINHPDHRRRTALMYALEYCQDDSVAKLIMKKGADPRLADQNGWTSLHFAMIYKSNEIIGLILEKYDFKDSVESLYYLSVFEFACKKAQDPTILPILFHHGLKPVHFEKCLSLAYESRYGSEEKFEYVNSLRNSGCSN